MDSVPAPPRESSATIAALPQCILHRVFHLLTPKDLSHTSAVCRHWRKLNHDVVGSQRWRTHYASRWPLPLDTSIHQWDKLYSEKILHSGAYGGKFFHDSLFGHRAGVRTLRLCPQRNLLASGSLDRTVRLWDLKQGMLICTSHPHEGTVRALALTKHPSFDVLRLISAADSIIRIWTLPSDPITTQLKGGSLKLKGHTGPVSSLSPMDNLLFSSSWDCSVCMWMADSDEKWQISSRYVYHDWVWSVEAKHRHFVVCSGRKVIVQDIETGHQSSCLSNFLTEGHVTDCQITQDERCIMTCATDGVVRLHDTRCRNQFVEIAAHSAGVTDISFEDPWIAAGSLDGTISLTNIEERLRPKQWSGSQRQSCSGRQLQCQSGSVYSVHLQDQWIACGAEQSIIRTWDFTKAAEVAKKAEISRKMRKNRKNRPRLELPKSVGEAESDEEEEEEEDGHNPSEQTPMSCRLQHRRSAFWKSFRWGDSTDDSELIDAFG